MPPGVEILLESVLQDCVNGQVGLNRNAKYEPEDLEAQEEVAFTLNIFHKLDTKIKIVFFGLSNCRSFSFIREAKEIMGPDHVSRWGKRNFLPTQI